MQVEFKTDPIMEMENNQELESFTKIIDRFVCFTNRFSFNETLFFWVIK